MTHQIASIQPFLTRLPCAVKDCSPGPETWAPYRPVCPRTERHGLGAGRAALARRRPSGSAARRRPAGAPGARSEAATRGPAQLARQTRAERETGGRRRGGRAARPARAARPGTRRARLARRAARARSWARGHGARERERALWTRAGATCTAERHYHLSDDCAATLLALASAGLSRCSQQSLHAVQPQQARVLCSSTPVGRFLLFAERDARYAAVTRGQKLHYTSRLCRMLRSRMRSLGQESATGSGMQV